jgi:hypothetical protein
MIHNKFIYLFVRLCGRVVASARSCVGGSASASIRDEATSDDARTIAHSPRRADITSLRSTHILRTTTTESIAASYSDRRVLVTRRTIRDR